MNYKVIDKETYYNLIHASVLRKCSDDNYISDNKSGERWTEEEELILMRQAKRVI